MISKLRDKKEMSRVANGGLKDYANRAGIKPELASAKRDHQHKGGGIRGRATDGKLKEASDILKNLHAWSEGKTWEHRQCHGGHKTQTQSG